MATIVNKWKVS